MGPIEPLLLLASIVFLFLVIVAFACWPLWFMALLTRLAIGLVGRSFGASLLLLALAAFSTYMLNFWVWQALLPEWSDTPFGAAMRGLLAACHVLIAIPFVAWDLFSRHG